MVSAGFAFQWGAWWTIDYVFSGGGGFRFQGFFTRGKAQLSPSLRLNIKALCFCRVTPILCQMSAIAADLSAGSVGACLRMKDLAIDPIRPPVSITKGTRFGAWGYRFILSFSASAATVPGVRAAFARRPASRGQELTMVRSTSSVAPSGRCITMSIRPEGLRGPARVGNVCSSCGAYGEWASSHDAMSCTLASCLAVAAPSQLHVPECIPRPS